MRPTRTCEVCGRFLSAGARHDLARSCAPPPESTREYLLPVMRTPFQAWPEAHLHHGPRGRAVTTPLPGLGPRLVEGLARHLSACAAPEGRRRYGPAAALRELLDLGAEGALDRVLRPDPLPVSCGTDWHRVGLVAGRLVLHDHPKTDVDAELVALALLGTAAQGCLARAAVWEQGTGAHVSRWLGALPVLRAAHAWHEAGQDLMERDAWIAEGWGPEDLDAAQVLGVDAEEMLRWLRVSRLPDRVRGWRDSGWTVGEAVALMPFLTPDESARWRAAGLDVNRIHEARRAGLDVQQAAEWHQAGWPLLVAGTLAAAGCTVAHAGALLAAVGRRAEVVELVRLGVLDPQTCAS